MRDEISGYYIKCPKGNDTEEVEMNPNKLLALTQVIEVSTMDLIGADSDVACSILVQETGLI